MTNAGLFVLRKMDLSITKKYKRVIFVFDDRSIFKGEIVNSVSVTVIDPDTGKYREITLPKLSQGKGR